MSIVNTELAPQIIKQTTSDVGVVHYFNHVAVVEFNEGSHIDIISGRKILTDIISYFGNAKVFGVVSNRINSYSVSTLDIKDVRQALPNLAAYGIVSYNEAGRMSAQIESAFCLRKDICFNDLYEGLDTVYQRVKDKMGLSLN
ncbi:hypothetical protein [Winogradskyella sp. PE311]|uniref:hypothetical protein n=1 Tax=Winogradskyella sp. PE311 TaxID=3366943 RepID=UPI00397EAF5D